MTCVSHSRFIFHASQDAIWHKEQCTSFHVNCASICMATWSTQYLCLSAKLQVVYSNAAQNYSKFNVWYAGGVCSSHTFRKFYNSRQGNINCVRWRFLEIETYDFKLQAGFSSCGFFLLYIASSLIDGGALQLPEHHLHITYCDVTLMSRMRKLILTIN